MNHTAATVYPSEFSSALQSAAQWPRDTRIGRIDALTDELARRGFCRKRSDDSLYPFGTPAVAAANDTQGAQQ